MLASFTPEHAPSSIPAKPTPNTIVERTEHSCRSIIPVEYPDFPLGTSALANSDRTLPRLSIFHHPPRTSPHTLVAAVAFTLAGAASQAHSSPDPLHATPRLLADSASVTPGKVFWLALAFDIQPGWHLYWNGLDGEGSAPEIKLSLPPGFTAGDWLWPAPKRLILPGNLLNHVYEKHATLLIPITPPSFPDEALAPEPNHIKIDASLSWIICGDICLPEESSISITLPLLAASSHSPPANADTFTAARKRLPRPLSEAGPDVKITHAPSRFAIEVPDAQRLAFFPAAGSPEMPRILEQGERRSTRLSIDHEPQPGKAVSGILLIQRPGKQPEHFHVPPLASREEPSRPPE